MKIIIPVAAPIVYNPSNYLARAFIQLGHNAEVCDQAELYTLEPEDADYFCCVDSGGPLNLPEKFMSKSCFWFIDSRRNHRSDIRNPNDDEVAARILEHGGMIYQAQLQDVRRLESKVSPVMHNHIVWLPNAADPDVWSNRPLEEKKYHCAFVGNCYDPERLGILTNLSDRKLLYWPGIEKAIMEEGAKVYRQAYSGLNIPSWYNTPDCYDINMRVFEIMSCGIALITNELPELRLLNINRFYHCLTYSKPEEIPLLIQYLSDEPKVSKEIGEKARDLVLAQHTYTNRAETILGYANGK